MKRIIGNALIALVFLLGLGLVCYPTISNWYNEQVGSYHIKTYQEAVDNTPYEEYEALFSAARSYNETLTGALSSYVSGKAEGEDYIDTLNINNGMIGALIIDKISVSLPIYHGTDEGVLQGAIGHLEGSSLPTGAEGEHTVLTGHTGLPSATLLTNLTQMEIGDTFEVHVLNEIYTYEVYDILVVEPYEMDALAAVEGKNLATLVTCTPYGVNSHRLFVQGELISTEVTSNATDSTEDIGESTQDESASAIPSWAENVVMTLATGLAEGMRSVNTALNQVVLTLQSEQIPHYWFWLPLLPIAACLLALLLWRRTTKQAPKHYKRSPQHDTPPRKGAAKAAPKHYAKRGTTAKQTTPQHTPAPKH